MPLTYGNVAWPPPDARAAASFYSPWAAWYGGDPDHLAAVYGGGGQAQRFDHRYERVGGQTATLLVSGGQQSHGTSRFWWGRRSTSGQNTTKLHIPAPADISSLSADLLFAEPPSFELDGDDATQVRLDQIVEDSDALTVLHEAAEICSGYGGVYLRACVDTGMSDVPLIEAIPPDRALPTWRYGRLTAVTFWAELPSDDAHVWRHLERHEVIGGATPGESVGVVYHGLYRGDAANLGVRFPLIAHPDTQAFGLMTRGDPEGGVATGASVLDVAYVPNMRPHRLIRGTPLGRSDYAGAESSFDMLDETWSSWMRDIRLAKGRMVVPEGYLRGQGRGQGSTFDIEQEIFQPLKTLGGDAQAMQLEQVQFAIRVNEHRDTTAAQWRIAMRAAGLSADAFGEEVDGGNATAKEIGKRGERTSATRSRKISYWRPACRQIALVLLQLDATHYRSRIVPAAPDVEWPDAAAPDPETLARTIQLLDAAGAVSTYVRVRMVHPDWAEPQVLEEVARIRADADALAPPPLQDPGTFTGADPSALPVDDSAYVGGE